MVAILHCAIVKIEIMHTCTREDSTLLDRVKKVHLIPPGLDSLLIEQV